MLAYVIVGFDGPGSPQFSRGVIRWHLAVLIIVGELVMAKRSWICQKAKMGGPMKYDYWEGENYKTAGHFGIRLLILGESSYGSSDTTEEAISPDDLVRLHIEHRSGHWGRTYTRFLQVLTGERPVTDRAKVWAGLAFHNFMLCWAAQDPMTAPAEASWSDPTNLNALREVCNELQPDAVIVWGYRLWDRLEAGHRCLVRESNGDDGLLFGREGPRGIPAFRMEHPWTPRMSFESWAPRIKRFLDRVQSEKNERQNWRRN